MQLLLRFTSTHANFWAPRACKRVLKPEIAAKVRKNRRAPNQTKVKLVTGGMLLFPSPPPVPYKPACSVGTQLCPSALLRKPTRGLLTITGKMMYSLSTYPRSLYAALS